METISASPGSVSHYRLLSKIGAGGMGEVWLAKDTQLPRKVAVKLLPMHAARDPQAVARLLREAQAAATADHPAVVTVYEAGVSSGVASLKGSAELTSPGSIIGTPLTMSPEQVQGRPADNRSDLWALGVILYAALTGRETFAGETPLQVG